MRRFLLYLIKIGIPVILLICSINLIITPEVIYKCDYMDRIIDMARQGYNTTNVESNLDERIFKKKYAELYKNHKIDYLILGSSRLMPVSQEAVKGASILNLAISGAKIEDLIAIYQVSRDNHITASNVILGIDPLFFNANYGGEWWKAIAEYYYEFENITDFVNYSKITDRLFSIDYFRLAINSIQNKGNDDTALFFTKNYINNGYTRRKDGAIYYPKGFREEEVDEVNNVAINFDIHEYAFDSLSTERINMIEELIDSIQKKGSNIIILCCPYHPIMYQRISQRKCVQNTILYLNRLTEKKQIKMIGHYDPKIVGFSAKDFYDATHAKKESIDTLLLDHLFLSDNDY